MSNTDWSLTSNPKMLPLNKVDPLPKQWLYAYQLTRLYPGITSFDRGLFDYKFVSATSLKFFLRRLFPLKTRPRIAGLHQATRKENGMATFEGSVVIDTDYPEVPKPRTSKFH
ncbi:hypothetical protein N5V81_13265 [Escherichia coli]|nr:hypothetical protein [Escherichia coli]